MTIRSTRRAFVAALAAGAAVLAPATVGAQGSYPSRPIRLIVPFSTGGTTDIVARVMSDSLGKSLGQPVVVDNKAGGGGIVGSAEIAKQAIPRSYIVSITGDEAKSAASAVLNVLFTANPKSVGGKLPGDDLYAK